MCPGSSQQGIIYYISDITSPNYLAHLSSLRRHLGIKQMLSDVGIESGEGIVQVVGGGRVWIEMSAHCWLSVGPRFNLLLFSLVPKFPRIVLSAWAMSFHVGNLDWWQEVRVIKKNISKYNSFCLPKSPDKKGPLALSNIRKKTSAFKGRPLHVPAFSLRLLALVSQFMNSDIIFSDLNSNLILYFSLLKISHI